MSDGVFAIDTTIHVLPIDSVRFLSYPDGTPYNPRGAVLDTTDLQETMQIVGQIDPIAVTFPDDGVYYVLHGHRRLTALRQMGEETVRAHIYPLHTFETEYILQVMASTSATQEIHPLRKGEHILKTTDELGWSVEHCASVYGMSIAEARLAVQMARETPAMRQRLLNGEISVSTYRLRVRNLPPELKDRIVEMDRPTISNVTELVRRESRTSEQQLDALPIDAVSELRLALHHIQQARLGVGAGAPEVETVILQIERALSAWRIHGNHK